MQVWSSVAKMSYSKREKGHSFFHTTKLYEIVCKPLVGQIKSKSYRRSCSSGIIYYSLSKLLVLLWPTSSSHIHAHSSRRSKVVVLYYDSTTTLAPVSEVGTWRNGVASCWVGRQCPGTRVKTLLLSTMISTVSAQLVVGASYST
jgi:hypothetical protein